MQNEKCTNENPCGNCDICDMEPSHDPCEHGFDYVEDCAICSPELHEDDERHEMEMRSELDTICEHGVDEDDCMECGARMDALAERSIEQAEWDHFHPADDE